MSRTTGITAPATLLLCALFAACDENNRVTSPTDATLVPTEAPLTATSPARARSNGTVVYGLTADNILITFDVGQPNRVTSEVAITGLQPGERIVGIDFRPSDLNGDAISDVGKLYGVSSTSRVYPIDPQTGQAGSGVPLVTTTGVAVALSGASFGVGFNPVPDRLRVHSDADQNLRINVDNGITAVDTALSYPADGMDPNIVATGYTNNDNDPATATTLYAIDSNRDALTVFNIPSGPNSGKMSMVGFIGVHTGDATGLDIAGNANVAYAAFSESPSGKSTLYTLDLSTGAASKLGLIAQSNSPLISIAVLP